MRFKLAAMLRNLLTPVHAHVNPKLDEALNMVDLEQRTKRMMVNEMDRRGLLDFPSIERAVRVEMTDDAKRIRRRRNQP